MAKTAVQFGAGNIGRGFIAQLFFESGYEVVFVDVVAEMLDAIGGQGAYTIHIVGPDAEDIRVTGVRAIHGGDADAVAQALAECDVACTAVGAGALRYIAPNIARGLARRAEQGRGPLNILVCENLHEAGAVLRGLVASHLDGGDDAPALRDAGFVQAVVSRMVPLQPPGEGAGRADIRVEAYKRLPVDAAAIAGTLPQIAGVIPVASFEAHEARKLYVHNCAHAALGYLGYLRGIEYGYEALVDHAVRGATVAALDETGMALVRAFGFDADEHAAHVRDLLERFANVELGDTCYRLARDPVRKLAPADRLVGAARLCEAQGIVPRALAAVIGAAYRFDAAGDPVAVALQDRIANEGLDAVMRSVSAIDADEPLGRSVRQAYATAVR